MTRTRRRAAQAAVVLVALGWAFHASATESSAPIAGQPSRMASDARVRGASAKLVTLINEAAARSETFRGLVNEIGQTDGVVYVAEGHCEHGGQACLLHRMTIMGPHRALRIVVDPRRVDCDVMGSIGHELQHALEVLTNRWIRSSSAMVLFYLEQCNSCGTRFETDAAIRAGDTVRAELRAHAGTDSLHSTSPKCH